MKKLILFICILFSAHAFGQVPSYVPANGLVGYWPFNGNANDESGNGNDGVVFGSSLTNDRFGSSNNAYGFNGIDNLIQCPISNLPVGNSARSIFCWARTIDINNAFIDQKTLFHYGNVVTNERSCILIWPDAPSYIGQTNDVCYGCSGSTSVTPPGNVVDSMWHFYGITYDSDTLKLFTDGVLTAFRVYTYNTQSTGLFKIGFSDSTHFNGEPFIGDIDDVLLYDRALSQQEITDIYNGIPFTPCTNSNLPLGLSNGLVAWYPFCGNANDESGNGNNGVVNGATLTSDRFGNVNSAYDFDGINNHILIPNSLLPANENSYSISLWVNPSNFLNNYSDIISDRGSVNYHHKYRISMADNGASLQPGTFYCIMGDGISETHSYDTTYLNLNLWTHYIVVFDTILNEMKTYKNGNLVDNNASTGVGSGYPNQTTSTYIGQSISPSGFDFGFHGLIDDIGIWDRALTQQEITNLYNTGICYQTITVTDTLIINAILTGFNPVVYQNSIKVYPNPSNDHITIDCGANYNTLNGYSLRIDNLLSQTVYTTSITQQSYFIDLNTWTGNGVYLIYLINDQGTPIDVRKIIIQ